MKGLKTENKKIHMLNARDNIIITVINKGINMYEETNNEFTIVLYIIHDANEIKIEMDIKLL